MSSSPPPQSNDAITLKVKPFSSIAINSGAEIIADNIQEFNSAVVEFNKSCDELEVERSDWEDEKTMIANT